MIRNVIGMAILLAAFVLPAVSEEIVTQGTYVMDSIIYPDKHDIVSKPADLSIIVHLEVVKRHDWNDKHYDFKIPGGLVRMDGVPDRMKWQSHIMGEPDFDWVFYFQKDGRMEIWNQKINIRYEMHKQ